MANIFPKEERLSVSASLQKSQNKQRERLNRCIIHNAEDIPPSAEVLLSEGGAAEGSRLEVGDVRERGSAPSSRQS